MIRIKHCKEKNSFIKSVQKNGDEVSSIKKKMNESQVASDFSLINGCLALLDFSSFFPTYQELENDTRHWNTFSDPSDCVGPMYVC